MVTVSRTSAVLAATAALVGAAACGGPGEGSAGGEPPATEIAALSSRYWDAYLSWNPLQATYLGVHRLGDRVPDITPAGRTARAREVADLADALDAIDFDFLPEEDRLTYLALAHQIDLAEARLTCAVEDWVVDHRHGFQLDFLHIATAQPLATPVDGERMIRRWNAMPDYIDQAISNLRGGIEIGRVAPQASVHRTILQLDALLGSPVEEWPVYGPAGASLDTWPEGARRNFRTSIREAAVERIRPAYERYRDFLRDELFPRSRTGPEAGLGGLPGGAECYRALIRVNTNLDLTAGEIHETGLAQVASTNRALLALASEQFGSLPPQELRQRLSGDREMFFRWPDEIVGTAKEAYSRAREVAPGWFPDLPGSEMEVSPIPLYEAPNSSVAYYRQPAPDGSRPGTYYVNTYRPETRPRYQAEALAFHEGLPGHHLQVALAQEIEGMPEFRLHLGSMAFAEGWALYAELLADEMGLYSDDLQRLGRLSYDAWRASRLVVDTGIHSRGWTRDEAADFLRRYTLLSEANIENEVDRYITSPAQALSYKIGQMEILALRTEAIEALGPRYSASEFHEKVLSGGALPLPALRESVTSWIAARTETDAAGN